MKYSIRGMLPFLVKIIYIIFKCIKLSISNSAITSGFSSKQSNSSYHYGPQMNKIGSISNAINKW